MTLNTILPRIQQRCVESDHMLEMLSPLFLNHPTTEWSWGAVVVWTTIPGCSVGPPSEILNRCDLAQVTDLMSPYQRELFINTTVHQGTPNGMRGALPRKANSTPFGHPS